MNKVWYVLAASLFLYGCGSHQESTQTQTAKPEGIPQVVQSDAVNEGILLLSRGDAKGAVLKFKEAIAKDPQNSKAYFILGQTYMRGGDYNNAIEGFKLAVAHEPDNADAYLLMGGCYDLLGKKEDAIESVQKSVEIFQKKHDEMNFKKSLSILLKLKGVHPPIQTQPPVQQ